MENAAYCAWIINPAHWGGGIELSILASHYRREIAAWNLATGACHVFGEDAGVCVFCWALGDVPRQLGGLDSCTGMSVSAHVLHTAAGIDCQVWGVPAN
jgi:hypothetical protein